MTSPTLIETASEWSLFQKAMGESCHLNEKEFRRLRVPERLRALAVLEGEQAIVDEISALLVRLRISHEHGEGGFDCVIQPNRGGVTMGRLVSPYDDPVFRPVDPCRLLPSLLRLEKKVIANPEDYDFFDLCKQVRQIISRVS